MGYRTPTIGSALPAQGAMFTDLLRAATLYRRDVRRSSRASCRSVLACTKVGMPGASLALKAEDPTIAQVLTGLTAYATGQFWHANRTYDATRDADEAACQKGRCVERARHGGRRALATTTRRLTVIVQIGPRRSRNSGCGNSVADLVARASSTAIPHRLIRFALSNATMSTCSRCCAPGPARHATADRDVPLFCCAGTQTASQYGDMGTSRERDRAKFLRQTFRTRPQRGMRDDPIGCGRWLDPHGSGPVAHARCLSTVRRCC